MAKYVLLYSGGAMGQSSADQQKILQAWGAWFGKLGKSLVDGGNPFSDKVKRISADGKVTEGAVGERASGYSIVEARTLDEATTLAKGCPVLTSGGRVTVYETFNPM